MTRTIRTILAVVGCCAATVALGETPAAWILASNRAAEGLLSVQAKYAPESSSALGLERYDTEILDLKPRNVARQEADLDAVAAQYAQALQSEATLAFLRREAQTARYVTAVCTGALVLGAAGLLKGYRATTHWMSLDLLPLVGAIPVRERIVIDRNRITGGGVTAGIDFALRVAAELCGQSVAEGIQLAIEYNPAPPFRAGSPQTAPADVLARVVERGRSRQEARRKLLAEVAKRAGLA